MAIDEDISTKEHKKYYKVIVDLSVIKNYKNLEDLLNIAKIKEKAKEKDVYITFKNNGNLSTDSLLYLYSLTKDYNNIYINNFSEKEIKKFENMKLPLFYKKKKGHRAEI